MEKVIMGFRQIVLLYNKILRDLDKEDEYYSIKWKTISSRRDEIIQKNDLYSKEIRLKSNWYSPSRNGRSK